MSVELSCLCLFSGVFSSSCSAAVLLSASRLCSLSRRVFRASGFSSSSSMFSLHHWFVSDSDIPVAALRRLCVLHPLSFSAPYPCVFFLQHGCSHFACFGLLRFLECFLRLNGSAGVLLLFVLFGVSVCCPGLFYVCCVFIRAFRFFVCS